MSCDITVRWRRCAVAEGFEPSDGGYPSHAFEACSLGRSDTPPPGSLPNRAFFPSRSPRSLAGEERLQRRGALLRKHTAAHGRAMVEPTVTDDVPQRADRSRFGFP